MRLNQVARHDLLEGQRRDRKGVLRFHAGVPHEDREIVTEHSRGMRAAGVARAGCRCYGCGGGSGRGGGKLVDQNSASWTH